MPVRDVETWPEVVPTIEAAESKNEEIVQVVEAGNRILIISKRKPGRPPKVETRA
jgi:hypothetical protein